MPLKLYEHQRRDREFYRRTLATQPGVNNNSDPGTGKTGTVIMSIVDTLPLGKALVVAPKSILEAAWGADIKKFAPQLRYVVAYAHNRRKAFETDADVYIINHDGVNWLTENREFLSKFYRMDIDESTAFKNHTAKRSKNVKFLSEIIPKVSLMTGSFTPNSVLDAWHQILLIDGGERLGDKFYKFRSQMCNPMPGFQGHMNWEDKPEAQQILASMIQDITVRHTLEDCIDIPANSKHPIEFTMNSKHARHYHQIERTSHLSLENGEISAFNAAGLHTKLLQAASGAVYTDDSNYAILDTARAELVIQLAMEREQCVVAFNWKHQRDQLIELAKKQKLTYGLIDGTVKSQVRTQLVDDFQAGKIKILFLHPQSGAHGLTLTKGTTTIWASPTANAEHFQQFNRRIYRAGQTRKTETLLVCAKGTKDEHYYSILDRKLGNMNQMLLFNQLFSKTNLKEVA